MQYLAIFRIGEAVAAFDQGDFRNRRARSGPIGSLHDHPTNAGDNR
jgi:hypothetical protein